MRRVVRTVVFPVIGVVVGAGCDRPAEPGGDPVPADTVASGTLVEAESPTPDAYDVETPPPTPRLETAEANPLVDSEPDIVRSVEVEAIVRSYARYYREELYEVGSAIRGEVDPALVAHARRRAAMDRGYVTTDAWDGLLAALTPAARRELGSRIDETNVALAVELHSGVLPDAGS